MKHDIFILQKDIPDAKAGTEFTYNDDGMYIYRTIRGKYAFYLAINVENNEEWFILKTDLNNFKNTTYNYA